MCVEGWEDTGAERSRHRHSSVSPVLQNPPKTQLVFSHHTHLLPPQCSKDNNLH